MSKSLAWSLCIALAPLPAAATTLTILHNNDGESRLLAPADAAGRGSLQAFLATLRAARTVAEGHADAVLADSSADNNHAGPIYQASLDSVARNGTFFDSEALSLVGYDAVALGNHDFDFGPEILAEFMPTVIGADGEPVPYLSANLAFAETSPLAPHVASGQLRQSVVVERGDVRVGVVGGITDDLPRISTPGAGTEVSPLAASMQAEIDRLSADGVDKIVVISHAQSIMADLEAIIPTLRGVDVYVAGGGDELLTSTGRVDADGNDLFGQTRFGDYPQMAVDADGRPVVVVTTPGEYRYVGMLTVRFDDEGEVVGATGGTLVADPARFGAAEDAESLAAEVEKAVDAFAAREIGVSEVPLNGLRGDVRTRQTNLGSLVADALAAEARRAFADRIDDPLVAFQNGGGIRNNSIMLTAAAPTSPVAFTELQAFEAVPFPNFVALIEDLNASALKATLEHAVSAVEQTRGQFLQVAGLRFAFDPARPAGDRVMEATLADGTALVRDGEVVGDARVDVATVDFLAGGGDGFDTFADRMISRGTVSQQQALARFVREDLAGRIAAADYGEASAARIEVR